MTTRNASITQNPLQVWRHRAAAFMSHPAVAAAELFLLPLFLALKLAHLIKNPSLYLFLAGWLSLWLRRSGWRAVGLRRPGRIVATVLMGIGIAIVYQALDLFAILPLIHRLTGQTVDIGSFADLRGNAGALAGSLAIVWLIAAFPEEMAFRGYLFNRFGDLFGRGRAATALVVILVSAGFGLAHISQGLAGVIDNVLAGALFAGLYLAAGRNLWLPIIAHGAIDTLGALILFLGYVPR